MNRTASAHRRTEAETEIEFAERLCRNINAYWTERGYAANARVETRNVVLQHDYVNGARVTLDPPITVRSREIVSDIKCNWKP